MTSNELSPRSSIPHFIHLFELTLRSDGTRYEKWIVIKAGAPETVLARFATEDEARDDAGARNGEAFMKAQRAGQGCSGTAACKPPFVTGFEAHP